MTKLLNSIYATQYFWFFSWGYFFSAGYFALQKFNNWLFDENLQLNLT